MKTNTRSSLLIFLATLLTSASALMGQVVDVGGTARNFTVYNHRDSTPIRLNDYTGQIVVLDFFAYWCGPCQASSPVVERDIQQYYIGKGGNPHGIPVQVLPISIDQTNRALTDTFLANAGIGLAADDTSRESWSQFTTGAIPTFVIINGVANTSGGTQWQVLHRAAGFPGAAALRQKIDAIQPVPTVNARPVNISTRSFVGTDGEIQIAGFVITGTAPKTVLIRASGPALGALGVPGTLADPVLTLFRGSEIINSNDDWSADQATATAITTAAAATGAFAWSTGSRDAALLVTLNPGNYTAQVSGKDRGTGAALIEVYDTAPASPATHLTNISTRSRVGTDSNIQIAGFVIGGTESKTVLIRASGPALGALNVPNTLADPVLELYAGKTLVARNDNWSADTANAARITAAAGNSGAFNWATGSTDAAMLMTLAPGNYTAQVSGKNGSTGVALVEVYEQN